MSKVRKYCFVPECRWFKDKNKIAIYHASKEMLDHWIQAVPSFYGKHFSVYDGICAKHFKEDDIIREWKSGNISVPYAKPLLSKQAIPCIFTNIEETNKEKDEFQEEICLHQTIKPKLETEEQCLFDKLCYSVIGVPNTSWAIHILKKIICINEVYLLDDNVTPYVRKQITVNMNLEVKYFYKSQQLNYAGENVIDSIEAVENIITIFDKMKICIGGPSFETYKPGTFLCNIAHSEQFRWRHNNCELIVHETDVCQQCKKLGHTFAVWKHRSKTKMSVLAKLRSVKRINEKIISR